MTHGERPHRGSRVVVAACWVVSVALGVAATWWAAQVSLRPPQVDQNPTAARTIEVQQGTLGRAYSLPALGRWALSPAGFSTATGVVTSVDITPAGEIAAGTRLMSVELRPVTAAQGATPAFRDLSGGATGADVAQLQQFLRDSGFLSAQVTGTFTDSTTRAVRAWQKTLGVEVTGVVLASDLLYLPHLPCRVVPSPGLVAGAHVPPDVPLFQVLADGPTITVPLEPTQMAELGPGASFVVGNGQRTWPAVIAETRVMENSDSVEAVLVAPDGGPVCAADCAAALPVVSGESVTRLTAQALVVPRMSGPMVPQSALGTDAGGRAVVHLADGTRQHVTVQVAADGQAIVEGIDVGTRVLLIAPQDAS